jgi:hypothetical protein
MDTPTFPADSPESKYLAEITNREIQTLAQGPAAAEASAEKPRLQAVMDSQEQAAADYVKTASPQTPPPSPKGFFKTIFSKGERL